MAKTKKKVEAKKKWKINTEIKHTGPWQVTPNALCTVCSHKYKEHSCEFDPKLRAVCYGSSGCSCNTYIFAS